MKRICLIAAFLLGCNAIEAQVCSAPAPAARIPGSTATSTGAIGVDGTGVPNANLSSTTPSADTGFVQATLKKSGSNISIECPSAATQGAAADSAVVHNTGDETIHGTKTFDTVASTGDSTASFQTTGSNTLQSYDYLANRTTTFASSGAFGRAPFADNTTMAGSQSIDHYHSFQAIPYFQGPTITHANVLYSYPVQTAGALTTFEHIVLGDMNQSGGSIGSQYGVHIYGQTKGSTNFAVATEGTTPSYFGGNVNIGSTNAPITTLSVQGPLAKTNTTVQVPLILASNESAASNPFGVSVQIYGSPSIDARTVKFQTGQQGLSNEGILALQPNGGTITYGGATVAAGAFLPVIEAWNTANLTNSWAATPGRLTPGYYREIRGDGTYRVWLRGLIKDGTIGSAAFTLPAGYIPSAIVDLTTQYTVGGITVVCGIEVGTDGTVTPNGTAGGTYVGLDGLSFDTR